MRGRTCGGPLDPRHPARHPADAAFDHADKLATATREVLGDRIDSRVVLGFAAKLATTSN
ncbi:hypothetical protein ABZZ20_24105 [Streptomyces sp. NPDC006430]|uniref:hypothetical protein n=1 Tax=Streptomyces sp. NPDC006430 TaxID=3154299 RepID=UPI0033A6B21C